MSHLPADIHRRLERGPRPCVAPVVHEATALGHLADLCEALNGAFISSWQSTAAWQKQLDAANQYLKDHL